MSLTTLSKEQKKKLERLFKKRALKPTLVQILTDVRKQQTKEERKEIVVKKGMSYANLAENISICLKNGWLTEKQITETLSDAEIAGNQHIFLFKFGKNDTERSNFLAALSDPSGKKGKPESIRHFFDVPNTSMIEVISASAAEVTLRLVAKSVYWTKEELAAPSPDKRLFEWTRHQERVAIIIRASKTSKLIQFRIPPNQTGSARGPKSNLEFLKNCLGAHFDVSAADGWYRNLEEISLGDTFPHLITDRAFLKSLWSDTPENREILSSIRQKGRPKPDNDLRDNPDWHFDKGYARKSLSGFFSKTTTAALLYLKLYADKIGPAGSKKKVARIVVTKSCADADIENAIRKIHSHV